MEKKNMDENKVLWGLLIQFFYLTFFFLFLFLKFNQHRKKKKESESATAPHYCWKMTGLVYLIALCADAAVPGITILKKRMF